jgi:hypothetical protein
MVQALAQTLGRKARNQGLNAEFLEMEGEEDPFKVV